MSKSHKPIWVIKVGSSLVMQANSDTSFFTVLAGQLRHLVDHGIQVALVSSGATALGAQLLNWHKRPTEMHKFQVAAAIGQSSLVEKYMHSFTAVNLRCGLILLTHAVISNRRRYINACSALQAMLKMNIVPLINENDTVITHEIQFGDNDNLAASVANMLNADKLVLLTDQDGLFSSDPRTHRETKLIQTIHADDPSLASIAGGSSHFGRGGMATKIQAARRASATTTIITSGKQHNCLSNILTGSYTGTRIETSTPSLSARKRWIANRMHTHGSVYLDAGAVKQISVHGRSLLPVGVTSTQGAFQRGALVSCHAANGQHIARGIINYSSQETERILGKSSHLIGETLGYAHEPELIHRDNMVVYGLDQEVH